MGASRYDDGRIRCDDRGLRIRWYYPWGAKRIPYARIRSIRTFPLSPVRGAWRIWGSGDLVHWYNLDPRRPRKRAAIELRVGRWIRPTITPDDVDAVATLIGERLAS